MFSLKYVTLIYLVVPTRSLLLNMNNPNGIRMSDYCPKMPHCEEGTHVLCMYYDPVRIMGPACSQDAHNVTASDKFKEELLDIVNEMRRRVAKGEEVGLNNQPLPKAYGMQKLDWDNELAAFAQIWANQCTMRHDLCRATKRFPDPGQITSIFRFSFPDWQVLSKGENNTSEKFLTDDKIILAMRKSLRNAYKLKKFLTKEMIYKFPDFRKQPELESSKIYLTVVDGKSTHVGCGVSAFSDYYGQVRDEDVIHNVVEIVCNFAAQPIVGEKVYETEKPKGHNFSPTCGCPPGFFEDTKDGFCINPTSRYGMGANYIYNPGALREKTGDNWCQPKDGSDKHCRPTVVLVPIFKMEDAPKNKLYKYQSTAPPNITDIIRSKSYVNNGFFGLSQGPYTLEPSDLIINKVYNKYTRHNPNNVKKRYFNRKVLPIYPGQNTRRSNLYLTQTRRLGSRIQIPSISKRDSIFTRVSKFKLPVQNKHQDIPINYYWINATRNINIKQVKPRKDFSKAKNLLSAYLEERKLKKGFSTPYQHNQMNTLFQINKKDFSTSYHDNQMNTLAQINKKDFSTPYHDNQMITLAQINKKDFSTPYHDNQMNSLFQINKKDFSTPYHDNQMNTIAQINKKDFSTPYHDNQMNTLAQINKKDFSTPYHDNQMNTLTQINKKDFSTPYHDNQMNTLVHDNQMNTLAHDNQMSTLVQINKKDFSTPYHDNQMNTLAHDNQMNTLAHSNYNPELNHSVITNTRTLLPEPNHENLLALTTTKKGDHKLLHLLETLEREMKNTELNRDLKEMVNAKIRKIYGSIVSDNAVQLKSDRSDVLDTLISKLEKQTGSNMRRNLEDDNTFEPTSTPKYDIPLKRNQNAISLYDRPSYTPSKSRFSSVADINNIYDRFLAITKNIYAKDDNYKRPSSGYVGKNSYDLHNGHEISGLDKIKYFQEKQEDLEKKLQSLRNSKHRYELQRESSRKMRPVFIPRSEPEKPRSTSNLQNFYVPDRSKFLHHI